MAMLVGAAALGRTPARAQPASAKRIGLLVIGNADVPSFVKELREGLRQAGRIEGRDYALELRSAEGQLGRLPDLAADLVRLKVDVIVALFTPCAVAAKRATRDIPIVILSGDPVGTGLVDSLARPGGNVTGLSQVGPETHAKCVELLRDMLPAARRFTLIANATDPVFAKAFLDYARRIGATTGTDINAVTIRPDELAAVFATAAQDKTDAVVFQASLPTQRVAELALAYRLPAATTLRTFPEVGGLMSYAPDAPEQVRRAATFVDRIFRGESPADIPVEQPTKFVLVINLKTAKAIGVTVPPTMLARADAVIE